MGVPLWSLLVASALLLPPVLPAILATLCAPLLAPLVWRAADLSVILAIYVFNGRKRKIVWAGICPAAPSSESALRPIVLL